MISADEYLMAIGKISKPVEKIQRFALISNHAEVAGVDHDVGLRQLAESVMCSVGV